MIDVKVLSPKMQIQWRNTVPETVNTEDTNKARS